MNNQELMIFFEEMNTQLKKLNSTYISYEENKFQLNFKIWEKTLLTKLSGTYYIRVKRMSIDYRSDYSYNFSMLQTILRDMYWKYKEKEKNEKTTNRNTNTKRDYKEQLYLYRQNPRSL